MPRRLPEVLDERDGGAVERGIGGQDARNRVFVRSGVVANDGGVDEEGEEGILVRGVVVRQQSSGVVVTVGRVSVKSASRLDKLRGMKTYQMEVLEGRCAMAEPATAARAAKVENNMAERHVREREREREMEVGQKATPRSLASAPHYMVESSPTRHQQPKFERGVISSLVFNSCNIIGRRAKWDVKKGGSHAV